MPGHPGIYFWGSIMGARQMSKMKNWPRYREVANILIKYGYGFLFERFTLHRWSGKQETALPPGRGESFPRRLREMLEELGPTYVKIGQLLSTRPDILRVDYIRELEKLQDEVPPFSQLELVETLTRAGLDLERDFAWFNMQPLAAASIAQVHEALTRDGQKIVLKIQRPGITAIIETDLLVMMELARLAEKRTKWGSLYRLSEVAEELGDALKAELDFLREARNAEHFYQNFKNHPHVIIPRVMWEFTSQRILAMEYVQGVKVQDIIRMEKPGFAREAIARHLVDALFHQLFEHGFFHADPHPGNLAIADGEAIIFYDFGQVGIVDDHLKGLSMNLITGMMRYDTEGVVRALLQIGISSEHVNREAFRYDVALLQQKYYGLPMSKINVGEALRELIDLSIKHQIRLPAQLSLMVKMLLTVESLVSQLNPELSIVDIAEPYGRRLLLKRFSPDQVRQSLQNLALDYLDVARQLPRSTANLVKIIEDGELKIKLEHAYLKNLISKVDIMSNRLSLSIIIAGIVVGTSLLARQDHSAFWGRLPLVELGFATGILLGLFLAYSIIKSGRY